MKIIPEQYRCEICSNVYDDKEEAINCEAKSRISYPIGLIYGDHRPNAFFKDITFAVADNSFYGHKNEGGSWACRDTGAGDSLGEELCGGNSLSLSEHDGHLDFKHPTFIRMVEYLKSENIPIKIWNGKEVGDYLL